MALCEDPYTAFTNLYSRVASLARKGVDVSQYVELLERVLTLLSEGSVSEAVDLMNSLNTSLSLLEEEAGNAVMAKNLVKYGSAALILSIPLITYLALPRLYLLVWFKSRRRWVVVNERNKR